MNHTWNVNASQLAIRMRHMTCIIPPRGVSETIEAYYEPLFKVLLHVVNNMHVTNADNENSIMRHRHLIAGSEFNFMREGYWIESVDLNKEKLNTYSIHSDMTNAFAKPQHANSIIENTLNI